MTHSQPALDPDLLALVRCPKCRGELDVAVGTGPDGEPALDCPACALRYPVRGGVPVLLVDDASPLS